MSRVSSSFARGRSGRSAVRRATLLALLLPCFDPGPAAAEDRQTVIVNVAFVATLPDAVEATIQQDGASLTARLVDDGSDANDARGDRVWTGTVTGRPAQYLPVRLSASLGGARRDLWKGVIRVGLESTVELAFEVTTGADGAPVASRRASASPGRVSHATEAVPLMAASFWATFLLVYGAVALWLGRVAPSLRERREGASGPPG